MPFLNLFSRFADDIEYMTGSRPNLFWMFCWKYVSPVALIVILISSFYNIIKETPQYELYVGCPQQLVSSVFSHRSYFILSDSQCKPFVVYLYFSFYASYPNCNVVKEYKKRGPHWIYFQGITNFINLVSLTWLTNLMSLINLFLLTPATLQSYVFLFF